MEKYGFVYIWRDRKKNKFYIGRHWGHKDDGYICSSNSMYKTRCRRPQDFKRRIISEVRTSFEDLMREEQRWLDMIPRGQFGKKYYNKSPYSDKFGMSPEAASQHMLGKWADPVYRESQLKTHWSKNGKSKEVGKKINTKERASKIKGTVQALYDNGYQNPNKGKFWINNITEERYIKGAIPEGWTRGRIFSEARSKDMNKRWACPIYRQSMSDKHKKVVP